MMVAALDVGTRRIGVAISDPMGTFAFPLRVIERTNSRDDVRCVVRILDEYACNEVVVGDPLTLDGKRGPATEKIDVFVNALARAFSGIIHRVDERLTTAAATKTLIRADLSRSKRKKVIDKTAAALILETFLARRRLSSER
ncbi:MAG: Holliday junction resolvase RuvX [Candidatus Eremiobacteraeota bacterium]|nr:Holliday junction resolvase RuvX [Candidatus Eremiobacteraeota bacterium]